MANRRSIRNSRNRPRTNRVGRSIAQVSTGIPRTAKRVRGNPPPINLVSAQSVRVSFNFDITFSQTAEPFKVFVGSSPVSRNVVYLYPGNSSSTMTCYLDIDEIYQAACVRVFGSIPSGTDANALSTELALQSVTFYGPLAAGNIRMGVDFGPGMPGASATDEGTSSARPVVKVSSPRLYWSKLNTVVAGDAAVGLWIGGFTPSGDARNVVTKGIINNTGVSWIDVARLDCTVQVRRSWYSANTASAITAKSSSSVME